MLFAKIILLKADQITYIYIIYAMNILSDYRLSFQYFSGL